MNTAPRELPPLASGVTLWWCELERTAEDLAGIAALLSPAELARAARFGTTALRERWIAGRGALRVVLGRTLGIDAADVALRRGVRGRPELADDLARVDFNVSHTRGVALVAIARDLPRRTRVGVDIEHRDREVGADQLARKFLTPGEQATLADLPPALGRQRFLRYWTCKEAMSKATGDGLIAPFRQLDVDLANPPRLRAGPPPYLPGDWSLHFADVPAAWLATVAIWRASP
ncbi:MAG: 4'-phosphopantetheinyl transferase superfamily protein [Casimicrobiaceae bacterium]